MSTQPATTTPTATPAPTSTKPAPTPYIGFQGAFDLKKAFEYLYGSASVTQTESGEVVALSSINLGDSTYSTTISTILAAPFHEGGYDKYVVFTQKPVPLPYNCHSCRAKIDSVVYVRMNGIWQVEARNDSLGELGFYGYAPDGNLVKIGPDKYGFLFRETYANTGYSSDWFDLYAVVDHHLQCIAKITTRAAKVIEDQWSWSSQVDFVQGSNPTFDDIRVVITGNEITKDGLISADRTIVYRFTGEKYEP